MAWWMWWEEVDDQLSEFIVEGGGKWVVMGIRIVFLLEWYSFDS